MRRRITTAGNSAALVLSQDLLGLMGIAVGDEVDVSLVDRTLVVRPVGEAERQEAFGRAVEQVLRDRRRLLMRLAEGVAAPPAAQPRRRRKRRVARR